MNQHEWIVCQDPAEMLRWLQLAELEWSTASNVARDRANLVTNDKLQRWVEACRYFFYHHPLGKSWSGWESDGCMKARIRDEEVGPVIAVQSWASEMGQKQLRADLLRDIIGDPFRPMQVVESNVWRGSSAALLDPIIIQSRWLTPTVLSLAQAADDEGAIIIPPERLLVLADALEEAGCGQTYDQQTILWHLRGVEICPKCQGLKAMTLTQWTEAGEPESTACPVCHGEGLVPFRGPHVRGCWAVELLRGEH